MPLGGGRPAPLRPRRPRGLGVGGGGRSALGGGGSGVGRSALGGGRRALGGRSRCLGGGRCSAAVRGGRCLGGAARPDRGVSAAAGGVSRRPAVQPRPGAPRRRGLGRRRCLGRGGRRVGRRAFGGGRRVRGGGGLGGRASAARRPRPVARLPLRRRPPGPAARAPRRPGRRAAPGPEGPRARRWRRPRRGWGRRRTPGSYLARWSLRPSRILSLSRGAHRRAEP